MARRRMIDPEFFLDEDMAALSAQARLLFIGSWTIADDRVFTFPFKPGWIKAQLFPYERVNMIKLITELVHKDKWQVFQNGTGQYVYVKNMAKYQTINRPSAQKYPAFDAEKQVDPSNLFKTTQGGLSEGSVRAHSEVKLSEVKLSKAKLSKKVAGKKLPAVPAARALTVPQQFVESFKSLYENMTQQPYKMEKQHFILSTSLIKNYGYEIVVNKVKLLAVLCRDKAVWFTRGGWADFKIEKLSNKWNEIIPEVKYDPEAEKQIKLNEKIAEVRKQNERINNILNGYGKR